MTNSPNDEYFEYLVVPAVWPMKTAIELKHFLDDQVVRFNRPEFIVNDPIQIPHRFSKLQDIEIAGFFAAILAWGQRKTIISKCNELMKMMNNSPYEFVLNHSSKDLKRLENFKHRTFNPTDLLYLIEFFNKSNDNLFFERYCW